MSNLDPVLAQQVVEAVRQGDVETLRRLLEDHPGLATARIQAPDCPESRTLLHVVTDWPGHFPRGSETVRLLVEAGADVNARFDGRNTETPLHWAASSNDVACLDALLDAGANIEAEGAVIGGGTPLADAVAFGQWEAARRLVERGARANLWQAAALGLTDRVEELWLEAPLAPGCEALNVAFWCACHGGQRGTAEYLLERGARLNWKGFDNLTPLGAAQRSGAHELAEWLRSKGARPDT